MKEQRCRVCSKLDNGENEGLEKVEDCRRCGKPVCRRCQCVCEKETSEN
jgi:hypothetical protein